MRAVWDEIRAWAAVARILFQYLLYRFGLRSRPTFLNHRPECKHVIGRILRWPSRVRMVGVEHCPKQHPAVFCCNHIKKDDPFVVEACIYDASGKNIWVIPMMRDDFFSARHKTFLYDLNELVDMFGTLHISRGKVTLSQIRPFVEHLRSGGSFLMFPGRTRSCSGLFMEYREGIEEPGGPSFFAAQAQRSRPDLRVPIVPIARSYNPATRKTTVSFGAPLYLGPNVDRAAQRALDYQLIEAMEGCLEIHVSHLVATLLYAHRLHQRQPPIRIADIEKALRRVLAAIPNRRVDPAGQTDLLREIRATLRYFARHGMLDVRDDLVYPKDAAILAAPPLDRSYRDANPVKFLANQIAHMQDVVHAVEDVLLF